MENQCNLHGNIFSCNTCGSCCNDEYTENCEFWVPSRGGTPSTPLPCEYGGESNDLCFEECNGCPNRIQ